MTEQPTPVFVVGSGRSGTTITAALLSRLPGVRIAKETGYIGEHLDLLQDTSNPQSLSKLIVAVNSWLKHNQWGHTASTEGFHAFCRRYDIQGGRAFIHYIWQLDSPTPWHELSFIGDNTPLYVMAITGIRKLMPEARFIHVIRDPRDVVSSILKMRFGADNPITAAMEWHFYLGCWLMAERSVPPGQRIECKYEDLCMTPEATFAKLAAFLNRSEAEAAAALGQQASTDSGPATGFEKIAALSHHSRLIEPLTASRVGRHTSELTAAQIQSIEEIAQYGMLAYGYTPSKWYIHPLLREDRLTLLRAMILDVANRCLKRLRGK